MNSRVANQPVVIVMIEDDEGHARLIEKNVRRAGVNNHIKPFANGSDAIEFLFGPDGTGADNKGQALLILLDLNLPDMSGVDILKRLKQNEHLKRSPVVVLTTTDDAREIQRCYDLGCNVYVTKPVNYENFAEAIRQLGLFCSFPSSRFPPPPNRCHATSFTSTTTRGCAAWFRARSSAREFALSPSPTARAGYGRSRPNSSTSLH
jgi:CheY-like chemotaxis protein